MHKEKRKDIKEEGDAEISFTVTSGGTVINLVVNNSPDAALSKHIIAVFDNMPAWSPAVVHNRTISYPVKLTVPYYRD